MGKTWPDRWFVTAPGGACDLFVIRGPTVPEIVERFTRLVGRIAPPQKFLFGFWISSLAFETAPHLLDVAARLRQEDWPCDNLVLDGPWRGGPEFIPNYQKFHEYALAFGARPDSRPPRTRTLRAQTQESVAL